MSIHPEASLGFARAAGAYERGRPDYPPVAVGWLASRLGLGPGRLVVDLGAGTGKLTRQLVPFGARVIALEPVPEMAAELARAVAGAEVLAASASATTLASGSVDAATAGQSFHWFADQPSLREIHRILRPGGRLGLVWNRRDARSQLWREVAELTAPLRRGAPDHSSGEWRRELGQSGLFLPLESRAFAHQQAATPDQLVDRILSLSYVAAAGAEVQARLQGQLLSLAEEYRTGAGQTIALPYECEVFACRAC
ncbi:MAG TPA: methyltransferase domain-containing protein [Candidatus Dormibacteraeota bacterium]|nr:methyltransferase domain-containing protein [Candidatus Dormibacteraeota bacterium]